jgi:hypothetical protein
MFWTILATIFIVYEVLQLKKAARMTGSDFPNLTPEQLELKRTHMRKSAWGSFFGAGFIIAFEIAGTFHVFKGAPKPVLLTWIVVVGVGFLAGLTFSAIHGSAAGRLK